MLNRRAFRARRPEAFAIWGSSPTDVYAVSGFANRDTVYHSSGDGDWDGQNSPEVSLDDIWGSSAHHVYAAGGGSVFFSRGDGVWTAELTLEDDAVNARRAGEGHRLIEDFSLGDAE